MDLYISRCLKKLLLRKFKNNEIKLVDFVLNEKLEYNMVFRNKRIIYKIRGLFICCFQERFNRVLCFWSIVYAKNLFSKFYIDAGGYLEEGISQAIHIGNFNSEGKDFIALVRGQDNVTDYFEPKYRNMIGEIVAFSKIVETNLLESKMDKIVSECRNKYGLYEIIILIQSARKYDSKCTFRILPRDVVKYMLQLLWRDSINN